LTEPQESFHIIVLNERENLTESVQCILAKLKFARQKSHLIVANFAMEISSLTNSLSLANQNSLFYLVQSGSTGGDNFVWNLLFSIKNQPKTVVNQLTFTGKY